VCKFVGGGGAEAEGERDLASEDLGGCVNSSDVDKDSGADFVTVKGGFVIAQARRWNARLGWRVS
jgi:hypothetical protein